MSSSLSGMEVKERDEDGFAFEIGVVISKSDSSDEKNDCIDVLINELKGVGLLVQRAPGLTNEFLKIAATTETLGKAAAELHIKKPTHIGMDLQFEWDEVEAFLRQPDGTLFSWCERFQCYVHLIYGIVNDGKSDVTLKFDGQEIRWEPGESLVRRMEAEHIVELVFPLHDEIKRKKLLRSWALNLKEFTDQPIDEVYSYLGTKVAVYFAFLGMYTRWLIFPAVFGLILQLIDLRSLQLQVLPIFFISIILWAVLFFQFWKRKNSAVLARWQINCSESIVQDYKLLGMEQSSSQCPPDFFRNMAIDRRKEAFQKHKEAFQRHEWLSYLMRFRNDSIIILSIVCLQLPFELAYAHLYTVIKPDMLKFGVTAVYLFAIQNFTTIGGKVAARLIKSENNENTECRADSLVYKVFGVYFMQSYIGVFYHALLHRNFRTLRQLLLQRLIISEVKSAWRLLAILAPSIDHRMHLIYTALKQVSDNLMETLLPYLKYKYKKFSAVRNKKKREKKREDGSTGKFQFTSRVEKEYMKPTYSASIGEGLEDGLFDDFLELALQFGMVMMFACAFPLGFVFLTVNNLTEIRADALKLLVMFKRPIPRAAATIGAWQNIFQFLIVMSICTNSALLVWLYDQEGNWKIEPGLAGILIMEHVLLIIKFALSHFVPEEPAWVRARRMRNATQAQLMCSKRILRSIFDTEKLHDRGYAKRLNKKWQSDRSWMPNNSS